MELIEDTSDTPEQMILVQDCSAQLRTCLALMSREHREIIDLVYYQEKSVEEVAEVIQMRKSTVKTRMFYSPENDASESGSIPGGVIAGLLIGMLICSAALTSSSPLMRALPFTRYFVPRPGCASVCRPWPGRRWNE
jgi:Sigma-70, region 4